MAPKIFALGITGYIGGSAVNTIAKRHPEYEIVASVRTKEQAEKVEAAYPNVKTVLADLDNDDVLSAEATKADIVLNFANADHPGAVKSLIKGLNARTASRPGYYIHTSGTGILIDLSTKDLEWGNTLETRILDDVADIKDILSLPATNLHVGVDNLIRSSNSDRVKVAIVTPPAIYGLGSGPDKTRSVQAPDLVKFALQRKKAFQIGQGKATWNNVDVNDLGDAYTILVEQAASDDGGSVNWGPEAFFFVENGQHSWAELSKEIARVGKEKGHFPTAEVDELNKEELAKEYPDYHYGALLWGSNSRGRASRIRQLGWSPTRPNLNETIPDLINSEAKVLGL